MTHELGQFHREGCASLVEDRCWPCNCDGPTALADLRERLAAAIEDTARNVADGYREMGEERKASVATVAYMDAALIIRNRP